jgi:hypothetical protein
MLARALNSGTFPVIIFLGPSVLVHSILLQVFRASVSFFEYEGGIGELMPGCGFIFAVIEFPNNSVENGDVEDACALNRERAKGVFTAPGSALSVLCSRPKADCSRGA